MNVYDFDGTIYHGDSSRDFYLFCLGRHPRLLRCLPRQGWAFVRLKLFGLPWNDAQAAYFCFLRYLPNVDAEVAAFWQARRARVKDWYWAQRREDDVIVSAGPAFLLEGLGLGRVIATDVDPRTGALRGDSCYGAEKVARFARAYPGVAPEGFWSDHPSDEPMARLARQAWLVRGQHVAPWPFITGA